MNTKAIVAAGAAGGVMSLITIVIGNLNFALEILEELWRLLFFYGAGVLYGVATCRYLPFRMKLGWLLWIVVSSVSYILAVQWTLDNLPVSFRPDSETYLLAGLLGAFILVIGYIMLASVASMKWLAVTVIVGGVVAYLVSFLPKYGDVALWLWPIWQVAVTWCLLKSSQVK